MADLLGSADTGQPPQKRKVPAIGRGHLVSKLRKLLGDRGFTALERLMGMLLVSIEMLMQGVQQYLGQG